MFHLTDDVLLQAEGAVKYPIPVLIFVVWRYGTLMLPDKESGYVIMLLGGLAAAGMIVIHSKGGVVHENGGLLFRVDDVRARRNGLVHHDPRGPRTVARASRRALRTGRRLSTGFDRRDFAVVRAYCSSDTGWPPCATCGIAGGGAGSSVAMREERVRARPSDFFQLAIARLPWKEHDLGYGRNMT